jgi:hypothetical protein
MSDLYSIIKKSIDSGISGSLAMTTQVCTLMPMRTIMNFQYRNGGSINSTIKNLYKEGGICRFYKGFLPAIIQAPLARGGDTFANTFALTLCKEHPVLNTTPILFQTMFASLTAGGFRILLMPIDTIKTSYQVNNNIYTLINNYKNFGPKVFYNGSLATCSATIVGHYPFFLTYNYLDNILPKNNFLKNKHQYGDLIESFSRYAFIGFCSSITSDTVSNSLRVLKTSKQTYPIGYNPSYLDITKDIINKDGFKGLFGRGLKIKIISNGIQGIMFSILWKTFENILNKK